MNDEHVRNSNDAFIVSHWTVIRWWWWWAERKKFLIQCLNGEGILCVYSLATNLLVILSGQEVWAGPDHKRFVIQINTRERSIVEKPMSVVRLITSNRVGRI